jgi:predicted nucleic-acid-binding Zn-ribbon protein
MNEDEAEWNGYVGSTQPKKALSRLKHDRCPSCDSTNYGQPQGHPNAVAQCYECGYNPRFHQETSALPSNGGPIQATKQVSTANNWNPQGIVGNVNSV